MKYFPNKKDVACNKKIKRRIIKNVLIASFTYFLTHIGQMGLLDLQSSLHVEQGLGTWNVAVRFASAAIGALFLANFLIAKLGQKWSMVTSFIGYIFWMFANGHSSWATMILGAISNGLGAGILWVAMPSYITEVAKLYAEHSHISADRMNTYFFGIKRAAVGVSGIVSSIVSNTLLKQSPRENFTMSLLEVQTYCGFNDCPWYNKNNTYLDPPAKPLVWSLVGIYGACCLIGILLLSFLLDPIDKLGVPKNKTKIDEPRLSQIFLSTFKMGKHYKAWLLACLNAYGGIFITFRNAEFNRSWITCAAGIEMVGMITIPRYVMIVPASFLCGYISKRLNRSVPMTFALILQLICLFTWLFWSIYPEDVWVLYLMSIALGIHSGILETMVFSLHGISFPNDSVAVYAWYSLVVCIMSAIPYGYSYYLCTSVKLYIMFVLMVAGFLSFYILEWKNKNIDTKTVDKGKDLANGENPNDETIYSITRKF